MKKILHYGLQRSGTNFFADLMRKNYRVRIVNDDRDRASPLQKHFRLYDNKQIIPEPQYANDIKVDSFVTFEALLPRRPDFYVIVSKDPYSWLLSYRAWAQKCQWPSVDFHYLEEYNLFYGKWIQFSKETDRVIFVRYLDLLCNLEVELNRLEEKMGIERRFFARFVFPVVPRKVSQSGRFDISRKNYYLNGEYLKKFRAEDLEECNRVLDKDVVRDLGYRIVCV